MNMKGEQSALLFFSSHIQLRRCKQGGGDQDLSRAGIIWQDEYDHERHSGAKGRRQG